jgi:hypothetical protein
MLMSHHETCGKCHTNGCVHTMTYPELVHETVARKSESYSITPGSARGCPLDVTDDPDLFDYSNDGDAVVIEEVGNVKR